MVLFSLPFIMECLQRYSVAIVECIESKKNDVKRKIELTRVTAGRVASELPRSSSFIVHSRSLACVQERMISMRAHLSRCPLPMPRAHLEHLIAIGPNLLRHFSFSSGEEISYGFTVRRPPHLLTIER
jgi:hypothetical protein